MSRLRSHLLPAVLSLTGSFSASSLAPLVVAPVLSAAIAFAVVSLPARALPAGSGGALAGAQGSKSRETSGEEKLDNKTADGKPYQITTAVINASPEDVFHVITDYQHAGKLFKNLTRAEVVSRDEEKKTSNVSFSLRGILNLWSFDYVLSIKENFPSSIEFHRLSGSFKRNEGYWKLLPLDGGRSTKLVYGKFIDAGMLVPPQIVVKAVRDSAQDVVANIKLVAEDPALRVAAHQNTAQN